MLHPFIGISPRLGERVFVASSADIVGDVVIGEESSVWFHATIRGDVNHIRIGSRSNIQDNAVVHVTNRVAPTRIGDGVTVGHSAVVHGCTIEDNVLIGIGAVILDHAVIGEDSLVGARALVTGGTQVPPRSLVLGSPARVIRQLSDAEVEQVRAYAANYVGYSRIYLGIEQPASNPFYPTG